MQAKWGTPVLRQPSSYTEVSSIGSPCTKLKCVPLERLPWPSRTETLATSTRRSNQHAGDTHQMQRTDSPFSPLACDPCRSHFSSFHLAQLQVSLGKASSCTSSPGPRGKAGRRGGFYSTNLALICDTTKAAGDNGCFI